MENQNLTVIILAAGQGTRMKSTLPKVCHSIGNAPLLWHVLSTAQSLNPQQIITVLSPSLPQTKLIAEQFTDISIAYQDTQKGTGHAVRMAMPLVTNQDN